MWQNNMHKTQYEHTYAVVAILGHFQMSILEILGDSRCMQVLFSQLFTKKEYDQHQIFRASS